MENSAHIYGIPFDFPVVGYNGKSVNYLRLFSAEGDEQLDINVFNKGGYIDALKDKIETKPSPKCCTRPTVSNRARNCA